MQGYIPTNDLEVQREERHLIPKQAVIHGSAAQSGVAACGLGVRAAARALDLDFVLVEWERCDLVILQQFYESELLQPLLTLLRGESFRKVVAELDGYDAREMGNVVRGT